MPAFLRRLRPAARPLLHGRLLCSSRRGRDGERLQDRLAVLIDADNVGSRLASNIFAEVAKHGIAVDKRVYGDFSRAPLDGWKQAAFQHGLDTRMQASLERASNKNATDIALVIDAMDILYATHNAVDGFVIVSNDGDFAPLAQRLRRQGKKVIGVGLALPGQPNSSGVLRSSVDEFILLRHPNDQAPFKKASEKADEPAVDVPAADVTFVMQAIE